MSQTDQDLHGASPNGREADLRRAYDVWPERECDVVMKGGITSGVIYPLAVCHLATRYRLVNVGGTSAGAVAAAAAAAAELGRQRRQSGRSAGGFRRMEELPGELGSKLLSLFQPEPGTRPLFQVMVAATRARAKPRRENPTGERGKSVVQKIGPILVASIGARFGWFAAGLAVPIVVAALVLWFGRPVSLAATLVVAVLVVLLGIILGLALVAWSLYQVVAKQVPANYFGICTGNRNESALTPWLSDLLDELSGNDQLPEGERRPLTFGDLWGEDAVDRYRDLNRRSSTDQKPSIAEWTAANAMRSINLEMMSTNLSDGRPYRLPTTAGGLSFCPTEMRDLFPEAVVAHMIKHSSPTRRKVDDAGTKEFVYCPEHEGADEPLYYLPRMPDLPVVVATRMSLSFPLLISAIPLYRVDYKQRSRPIVKCWFSDGGITSNFPVHFFDNLLPRRPTFGMNLRTRVPDHPSEDVYLPPSTGESERTRWRPMTSIFGFGGMIMDTMQNWSDEGQMTVPGFRDRVVHVAMDPDEGGMNLDMPSQLIVKLAERGRGAAQLLTGDGPHESSKFNWDEHRWTRYRTATAKLEQALEQFSQVYDQAGNDGFAHFINGFRPRHYVGTDVDGWLRFNSEEVTRLLGIGRAWLQRTPKYTDYAPEPDPELRMTARF